jgi:hypothetical protein
VGKLSRLNGALDNAARQLDNAARAADDLDMSTAARLARAQEQGFDTSRVLYHGTTATDIGAFNTPSVFTSRSPKVAAIEGGFMDPEDFAGIVNPAEIRKSNDQFSTTIYPLYSKSTKTAGIEDLKEAQNAVGGGIADRKTQDYLRSKGFDSVEVSGYERVELYPENIRSVNAKFDPANIGKNDLLGSVDPRLLPPIAAAAGIGVAAQNYDYGTPEIDAAYQEFRRRRSQKRGLWQTAKDAAGFGATLGSAVAGGIVGDLSRVGGYLNPFQPVEATEAGAQGIENALQYIPREPNPMLEGFGRQMQQFSQDIAPLTEGVEQSIPGRVYNSLPERVQGLLRIGADWAF